MEAVGLEPTMPGAANLQSAGVTNFPTPPLNHIETHSPPWQFRDQRPGFEPCIL